MKIQNKDKLALYRPSEISEKWIDWISEHGKTLLITSASILALLFLAFNLLGRFRGNAPSDYVEANNAYAEWSSALSHDESIFASLSKPIHSHPELNAKFGALIAQRFLELKEWKSAEPYAAETLNRLQEKSDFYHQFAKNSLLIAQGDCKTALEEAKKLKISMEKDEQFWKRQNKTVRYGTLLYAFNLLRVAMLEKDAGTPQGELRAWNEFERNAGWTKEPPNFLTYNPEAYHSLEQNFQEQEVSLRDFIKYRKAHGKSP